jgi:hypothetical protein
MYHEVMGDPDFEIVMIPTMPNNCDANAAKLAIQQQLPPSFNPRYTAGNMGRTHLSGASMLEQIEEEDDVPVVRYERLTTVL